MHYPISMIRHKRLSLSLHASLEYRPYLHKIILTDATIVDAVRSINKVSCLTGRTLTIVPTKTSCDPHFSIKS